MDEKDRGTHALVSLRWLRRVVGAVVLGPSAILFLVFCMSPFNSMAGYLRYSIPVGLYGLYGGLALISPLVGLGALSMLAIRRHELWWVANQCEHRLRDHVILWALAAVLAPGLWITFLPYVMLSSR